MGNPRAVLISLIIASLAMLLVWSFVKQQKDSILELATAKRVVVANQDINELTLIDETMLRIDSVPKSYIQPGIFVTIEDEFGDSQLILWSKVFARCRKELGSQVIQARGVVSKWDGTVNVIVSDVKAIDVRSRMPRSHDWH